jgi:hypothetical protein
LQKLIENIPYPEEHLSLTTFTNSSTSMIANTPQRILDTSNKGFKKRFIGSDINYENNTPNSGK